MANHLIFKGKKIKVGDLVRVHQTMKEGEKERVQVFEGRLIAARGREPNKTFTVRRIGTDNIGVEKIFPLALPTLFKIEVKKSLPARRAKLYYLRRQNK